MAIEEKKREGLEVPPDTKAVGQPAVNLEQATVPHAEPAAEQTPVTIHPEVEATGVRATSEPHNEMLSGSGVHAGSVDGSNVTILPTRADLETQAIKARSEIKGPDDSGKRWGTLARLLAGIKSRYQHPQTETLPTNITPISDVQAVKKVA